MTCNMLLLKPGVRQAAGFNLPVPSVEALDVLLGQLGCGKLDACELLLLVLST
jgi:hypothetical protein